MKSHSGTWGSARTRTGPVRTSAPASDANRGPLRASTAETRLRDGVAPESMPRVGAPPILPAHFRPRVACPARARSDGSRKDSLHVPTSAPDLAAGPRAVRPRRSPAAFAARAGANLLAVPALRDHARRDTRGCRPAGTPRVSHAAHRCSSVRDTLVRREGRYAVSVAQRQHAAAADGTAGARRCVVGPEVWDKDRRCSSAWTRRQRRPGPRATSCCQAYRDTVWQRWVA